MFNTFLEPCCSSGMRTNEQRVVAAVVLAGTIPLASSKVTDYSIRPQPVAELLYDLTSTYFEGAMEQNPKAKYGHSRDKRTDCLQVVIALVITPDGFPLAYEVMDGNTSDRATLRDFLNKIEKSYGKAKRMWVMDRGIPSEAILEEMREPAREIFYLVGTPKGKIQQHEKKWLDLPWQKVRESVEVKLFEQEGELYVLAKSEGRQAKETAMRRKRLARLLRKLRAMRRSLPSLVQLLMRLGAAKSAAGRAFQFVQLHGTERRPRGHAGDVSVSCG
jgi:transposase